MPGEEVIYHDVPSPRSAPATVPSGSAEEEVPPPPKKKCTTFHKICIAIILLCTILLSVVLTRPGAMSMFGRKPAAATVAGFPTYMPTYVPTYMPTYMPTYVPTYLPTTVPTVEDATVEDATTENVTDEDSIEEIIAGILGAGNVEEDTVANFTAVEEDETLTLATEAAVTTTPEATATVTTTTPEATTTIPPHPVCGNSTDSRVFKIQWTPQVDNATYVFTDIDETTVYSEGVEGQHPVGVEYEEKVCVLPGEYQFTMSSGACVNGYYRGELILFSCAEGSIVVPVVVPGYVEDGEV